jgi:integrase
MRSSASEDASGASRPSWLVRPKRVADDFLASHVAPKRKARTASEYERILGAHVVPALGSKRIVDVRRSDVAKLHVKLADSPYQANRALALVSAVWNWAARYEEVAFADNPARAIERYAEARRERLAARLPPQWRPPSQQTSFP